MSVRCTRPLKPASCTPWEVIAEFRHAYKRIVMGDVVPGYHERMVKAKNAQTLLIRGRTDRDSVEEHVAEYMDAFRDLRDSLGILDACRDDLNAKKEELDSIRRRDVRNALVTVLGILLTVLGIFVTIKLS